MTKTTSDTVVFAVRVRHALVRDDRFCGIDFQASHFPG